MKGYKAQEIIKLLIDNGWKLSHYSSNHYTYEKSDCNNIITVPTHRRKEISRPVACKILKMAGIR